MTSVAEAVISSIEAHGQFLTTLALASAGAAFAFLIQIIFHNSQEGVTAIRLRHCWILLLGIILNLTSIGCWFAAKSVLVAAIPAINELKWDSKSTTIVLIEGGFGLIPKLGALQIFFFSAALLAFLAALIFNFSIIRGITRR